MTTVNPKNANERNSGILLWDIFKSHIIFH